MEQDRLDKIFNDWYLEVRFNNEKHGLITASIEIDLNKMIIYHHEESKLPLIHRNTAFFDILSNNGEVIFEANRNFESYANVKDWSDLFEMYIRSMALSVNDLVIPSPKGKRLKQVLPITLDQLNESQRESIGKILTIPNRVRQQLFLLELYKIKLNNTNLTDKLGILQEKRGFYIYKPKNQEVSFTIPKRLLSESN